MGTVMAIQWAARFESA